MPAFLPFMFFQNGFLIVSYSELALPRYIFSNSVSGAASDSYWSGVVGSDATFLKFFLKRLISFPAHFLCRVNGWQACTHPAKGTCEGKTEQELTCG